MQMRSRRENGYLTVYLSLVFAIILSLLLALVEGAAMGAARLQAELVADLGIDSVFAEYHRELFSQYGLLFIDDSYGTSKGSISKIEKHLTDYMSYNMNPKKGILIPPGSNWIGLENIYLEIEEAALATDDAGAVWKAQAVDYVKKVDAPNIGVLLDTYHMNIEENSFREAILTAGDLLLGFHTGDNNRRCPGRGHINFDEIFAALSEIGYKGRIVAEPFLSKGGEVGRDIYVWRDLENDVSEAALDSEAKYMLNFEKAMLEKYNM